MSVRVNPDKSYVLHFNYAQSGRYPMEAAEVQRYADAYPAYRVKRDLLILRSDQPGLFASIVPMSVTGAPSFTETENQ